MKKAAVPQFLLMFAFIFVYSFSAKSQFRNPVKYWEWGVGVGTLNYNGDMTPYIDPLAILQSMRPHLMVNYKYSRTPFVLFAVDASYGMLYTNDKYYGNEGRNWVMNTNLVQLNGSMELNLRRFGKFYYRNKMALYGKGGYGIIFFNPDPEFGTPLPPNHRVYDGSYLNTNFFFGGGIKYRSSYRYIITFEATIHFAFADNLEGYDKDPVSFNDVYGGFRITIQKLMMGKNYQKKY